jgi:hypothetical protein
MAEDTKYDEDSPCTSNYTCTHDTAGGAITPASAAACVAVSAAHYTDDTVAVGKKITNDQITNLHTAVTNEFTRRRLNPKYPNISAGVNNKIVYSDTLGRIKANLARLGISVTGAAKGDKILATSMTGAFTGLNTSQDYCTCDVRCTCNARAADRVTATCAARCHCDCHCDANCTCDNRCACHNQWVGDDWGGCNCDGDCTCDSRCGCDCHAHTTSCTCNTRCNCHNRTTVECTCNVRDVCAAFVNN